MILETGAGDYVDLMLEVVEDEDRREEHEDGVGGIDVVLAKRRDPGLDQPNEIVARVSDCAGTEGR